MCLSQLFALKKKRKWDALSNFLPYSLSLLTEKNMRQGSVAGQAHLNVCLMRHRSCSHMRMPGKKKLQTATFFFSTSAFIEEV